MKRKNQHVIPIKACWAVKGEGDKFNIHTTPSKKEAVAVARKLAKIYKSELVIHNKDGKISDKDSYGNDPHPPKDKKH